ncbi:MAG: helix-turn-helix transcriptional regulator [Planctomycetes bacterium]|nr:helix-turn-helix transcriptional regulator [Planctomycetota bacterium]
MRSRVRERRLVAGLTQEDLAEQIGVSRQTVVSIEKGNYTPSVALALRLARVLATTVEELFELEPGDADD